MPLTYRDIARIRLANQHLLGTPFGDSSETVQALGAVQAQDFGGGKWALGLRTAGATSATIQADFDAGKFLRTHVLRPTWHFVRAEDIGWLLDLSAARVKAAMITNDRLRELDDGVFANTNAAIAELVSGGQELTRGEISAALEAQGLFKKILNALSHILMRAELDKLIISGAQRGKQQTFAAFDRRVPKQPKLQRDEALARLAERFFAGHGPATVRDFAWWSGLTLTEAKQGLAAVSGNLESRGCDGQDYWSRAWPEPTTNSVLLLPNYDEYTVGYVDRLKLFDEAHRVHLDSRQNPLFNNLIVIDGLLLGTWRKQEKAGRVWAEPVVFKRLDARQQAALDQALGDFERFAS